MFDSLDDTIVAISSPAGFGQRGIIRLSGPDACVMASAVFRANDGARVEASTGHRRWFGRIQLTADASVPGEAYVFRAPASSTRQDVVELHLVSAPPVLGMIQDALCARGARPASPGEFTARAFFNGAIDLTQAEAVAGVIHAQSDAQLRASTAMLHGRISQRVVALREELAGLLALLEAEIDFVEESIEFISVATLESKLTALAESIAATLDNSVSTERLETLPQVLLFGRANAGKSTLFNQLTGIDRAIASAVAGTTRDLLKAPMTLTGGEILLMDSAGTLAAQDLAGRLESEPERHAALAVERALTTADLVLVVVDLTDNPVEQWRLAAARLADRPCLIVLNKIDAMEDAKQIKNFTSEVIHHQAIAISAMTGDGITPLRQAIDQMVFTSAQTHGADLLALSNRQRNALHDAINAIQRAVKLCRAHHDVSQCVELLSVEVRDAMDALSLLTGRINTEDLLGRIFAEFCIGK